MEGGTLSNWIKWESYVTPIISWNAFSAIYVSWILSPTLRANQATDALALWDDFISWAPESRGPEHAPQEYITIAFGTRKNTAKEGITKAPAATSWRNVAKNNWQRESFPSAGAVLVLSFAFVAPD